MISLIGSFTNIRGGHQAMVAALEEKGYDVKHVFGQGGHSDNHGGAILPDILRWTWRDHQK